MNTDTKTAIASAVIAACALGLTVYQGCVTRSHNRLSVRPHVFAETNLDVDNHRVWVTIRNVGIGPAFIDSAELEYDKTRIADGWPKVRKLMGVFDDGTLKHHSSHWFEKDEGFPAAAEKRLFDVSVNPDMITDSDPDKEEKARAEKFKDILNALQKVRIRIEYSSAYGEELPPIDYACGP